jgi:hypothetical protein
MMKKVFAISLVMAMPASAASVVTSPVAVKSGTAAPNWVNAPLTVGGFAYIKAAGKCCAIVRNTDMVTSTSSDHQPVWIAIFYSDTSGNWRTDSDYWRTAELRLSSADLQGVVSG